MKKRSKKFWSLFAGFAMILSLLTGAQLHAEEETGSIIVHKLRVETSKEYEDLKKDLTKKGTGNEVTDGSLDKFKPFEGISFKLSKVKEKDGLTVANAEEDTSFSARTMVTDKNGLITFDNLPLGTYKLEELDNAAVKTKMETVLIEIPTYNPAHKTDSSKPEWLKNVHVYPKNLVHQDGPDIDKDVMEEGNQQGSIDLNTPFPWIIKAEIPTGIADAQEYKVLDTLDSQLDFADSKGISVKLKAQDGTETALTQGTDFTFTKGADSRSLVFDFERGLTKLATAENGHVVIKFYTTVNDTAIPGTSIENSAELNFTNKDGVQYRPVTEIDPEIHIGGVKIKKVDKDNPALLLPGAKFRIYRSEADALAGTNPVQRDNQPYEVTSGDDGFAYFYGLAYGENGQDAATAKQEYWVVETKAPVKDGVTYNRLLNPFRIEVSAFSHLEDNAVVVKNASGNFDLPFTGGSGTLLYITGGAILLGAAVLLLKNSRKNVS